MSFLADRRGQYAVALRSTVGGEWWAPISWGGPLMGVPSRSSGVSPETGNAGPWVASPPMPPSSKTKQQGCGAYLAIAASTLLWPALLAAEPVLGSGDGVGVDKAAISACVACHAEVGAQFLGGETLSSHRLLLDCPTCHFLNSPSGQGHAERPVCSECHSEVSHPADAPCVSCHDPHGTRNAVLVAPSVFRPDGSPAEVVLRALEGATPDGLAHGGSGLCETCHTATRFYRNTGETGGHFVERCAQCHLHVARFSPPARPDGAP